MLRKTSDCKGMEINYSEVGPFACLKKGHLFLGISRNRLYSQKRCLAIAGQRSCYEKVSQINI